METKEELEKALRIVQAVEEWMNNNNVMTIEDWDNILRKEEMVE